MFPSIAALVLTVVLASPTPPAMQNEPDGYGKAKFGMSPQQVEKLYEGRVRRLDREHLGATPVYSPFVVRQVLSDQKPFGLSESTNVELRYWKDKLWVVIVYYGANQTQAVTEALTRHFGPPRTSAADGLWAGKKVQVNTANRERWLAIADMALSAEAQKEFMEDMRKAQERARARRAPAAAATPHATPP